MAKLTSDDVKEIAKALAALDLDETKRSEILAGLATLSEEELQDLVESCKGANAFFQLERDFAAQTGKTLHECACDILANPESFTEKQRDDAEHIVAVTELVSEKVSSGVGDWAIGPLLKKRLADYSAARASKKQ